VRKILFLTLLLTSFWLWSSEGDREKRRELRRLQKQVSQELKSENQETVTQIRSEISDYLQQNFQNPPTHISDDLLLDLVKLNQKVKDQEVIIQESLVAAQGDFGSFAKNDGALEKLQQAREEREKLLHSYDRTVMEHFKKDETLKLIKKSSEQKQKEFEEAKFDRELKKQMKLASQLEATIKSKETLENVGDDLPFLKLYSDVKPIVTFYIKDQFGGDISKLNQNEMAHLVSLFVELQKVEMEASLVLENYDCKSFLGSADDSLLQDYERNWKKLQKEIDDYIWLHLFSQTEIEFRRNFRPQGKASQDDYSFNLDYRDYLLCMQDEKLHPLETSADELMSSCYDYFKTNYPRSYRNLNPEDVRDMVCYDRTMRSLASGDKELINANFEELAKEFDNVEEFLAFNAKVNDMYEYDHGRSDNNDDSTMTVQQIAQAAIDGDAAGVCRDQALISSYIVKKFYDAKGYKGEDHVFLHSYTVAGGFHTNVLYENPENGDIYKYNYQTMTKEDRVGTSALEQTDMEAVGLRHRIGKLSEEYDENGNLTLKAKSIESLPTAMNIMLYEQTGGNLSDTHPLIAPHADDSQSVGSIAFKHGKNGDVRLFFSDYVNGASIEGINEAGDAKQQMLGVSYHKDWQKGEYSKTDIGVATYLDQKTGYGTDLKGGALYLRVAEELSTKAYKVGDQSSLEGFARGEIQAVAGMYTEETDGYSVQEAAFDGDLDLKAGLRYVRQSASSHTQAELGLTSGLGSTDVSKIGSAASLVETAKLDLRTIYIQGSHTQEAGAVTLRSDAIAGVRPGFNSYQYTLGQGIEYDGWELYGSYANGNSPEFVAGNSSTVKVQVSKSIEKFKNVDAIVGAYVQKVEYMPAFYGGSLKLIIK